MYLKILRVIPKNLTPTIDICNKAIDGWNPAKIIKYAETPINATVLRTVMLAKTIDKMIPVQEDLAKCQKLLIIKFTPEIKPNEFFKINGFCH